MTEKNIYQFKVDTIKGEEVSLKNYEGKVLMIVNTASECGFTPQLEDLEQLRKDFEGQKFVAHLADDNRKSFQVEILKSNQNLILIGPEGDFTVTEIETALKENYIPVTLGEARLRTETAGMFACAVAAVVFA